MTHGQSRHVGRHVRFLTGWKKYWMDQYSPLVIFHVPEGKMSTSYHGEQRQKISRVSPVAPVLLPPQVFRTRACETRQAKSTDLCKLHATFYAVKYGFIKPCSPYQPYRAWLRCFVGKISRKLFLIRDSPASLPDGSGCWIRTIRMRVLWLQASHVLLIPTNLGYGTVLTAACARQSCSASDFLFFCSPYQKLCSSGGQWTPVKPPSPPPAKWEEDLYRYFISGGRKNVILLDGSQTLLVRPLKPKLI
jgi:hypothetical protein